jgi:hypothetical protein
VNHTAPKLLRSKERGVGMMTDDTSMGKAMPHIEKAINALEMMKVVVEGKFRLSAAKHLRPYYESLIESVLALQDTLVTDQEYTKDLQHGINEVSGKKAYSLNVTENYDGDQFYSIEAMLPLKELKKSVAFTGKRHDTFTVYDKEGA